MKKFFGLSTIILLFLFVLLFALSCEESKLENLEKRLEAFRKILPEELREKFDSGVYQDVVVGLDSLLSSDFDFKREYEKLKDKEAINVFSTQEVVDFYREYFVEEMNKLKKNEKRRTF